MSISARCNVFFLLVCLPGLPAIAQFNVDNYLSRSATDPEIQAVRVQQKYIQEGNFRSPFLREVELRMRARDMESGVNDYRLRVAPLNPFERRANKEHTALLASSLETENLVAFSEVLSRRYKLLIDFYYLSSLREIESGETERYRQLMRANSRRQEAGKELIELDRRIFQNDLQREDIQADIRQLTFLIRRDYDFEGELNLGSFQLVTVDQIRNDLEMPGEGQNLFVLREENKALLSEADWEINRQESFSNLGYLQAEYRSYRGETFNENFGLQLALQLPVVNPDRPDLARRRLDVLQDQQDVQEMEREVDVKLFTWENMLETKIAQYEKIEEKLRSFDNAPAAGYSNVEALLELVNYRNDLTRRKLDLYENILQLYIDWLQYKGMLTREPLINYLSASRTVIE